MEETGAGSGSLYASQVSADSWWTGSTEGHEDALTKPASIVLSNLPSDKTYRLRFFGSRQGVDGELDRKTGITVFPEGSAWVIVRKHIKPDGSFIGSRVAEGILAKGVTYQEFYK